MNTRIHNLEVYRIETVSGMKFWTLKKPNEQNLKEYGDKILKNCTLWDMLYLSSDGIKEENGKSLVRKSDLEFILRELVGVNGAAFFN